jgi:hypothetical protein
VTIASNTARKTMDLGDFLEPRPTTFKKVCKVLVERKLGDAVGELAYQAWANTSFGMRRVLDQLIS